MLLESNTTHKMYVSLRTALRKSIKQWAFKVTGYPHVNGCELCIFVGTTYPSKVCKYSCVLAKFWGKDCNHDASKYQLRHLPEYKKQILDDLITIYKTIEVEWRVISSNKKATIGIFTNKPVTKIHRDITYPEERQLNHLKRIVSKYGDTQWLTGDI